MTRAAVVPGRAGIVLPELEAEERPFHFLSGRVSLALVATVGERWRRNFERIVTPADLARWLVEADLLATKPRLTNADLDEARRLRDAMHVLACNLEDGEALDGQASATVEEAARRPALVPTFSGRAVPTRGRAVTAALSTVARDFIEVSTDPALAARVRHCGAEDCSLVFLDTSRPGTRRWCSMQGCGNRAKVRAHRAR